MSIPAVVLICVIFVDPALFANLVFRQPSGSDEGAGVIMLLCSQKWLRMGPIRSPAALPRTAIRGRAFLSEHPINSRFGLNKDGLIPAKAGRRRLRSRPGREWRTRWCRRRL